MESNACTNCNREKTFYNFQRNDTECKNCNSKRSVKRYYKNKDNLSNHQKVYYKKNRDKAFQKENERNIHFKDHLESVLN